MKSSVYPIYFISLLAISLVVTGSKVKDRFRAKSFDDDFKCKVLGFAPPEQTPSPALTEMFAKVSDFFTGGFKRFNSCTVDYTITEINMGEIINYETGEYDGITGLVQHDEYQSAGVPFKAAAHPYEPVKIGPVIMPADMSIISFRPPRLQENVQLEQFIYEFDHITYTYIALGIIFASLCMAIMMYLETSMRLRPGRRISIKKFLRKSFGNLHNMLMLLINQIFVKKNGLPNLFIWISVVIFVFILIFNLFLSLIRSSYVVTRQPPFIESLSDLVESNFTPVTFKGVNYEDTFRLSPSPELQEVYKRLTRNGSNNFLTSKFDFDPDVMEKSRPIFDRILKRKAAFLIDAMYVPFWKSGLCNFIAAPMNFSITPELLTRFTSTTEYFAPGILSSMFSPKIDPFLYNYVYYYFITCNELGIYNKLMHDGKYSIYFEDMITEWNITKCVDASERVSEDIDDHKQLDIENISNFLITMGRCVALSFAVWITEFFIHAIMSGGRMIKKKRRFKREAVWTLVNQ